MDIIGYEGLYKIYEDGRVWSIKRNKFLKGCNSKGYITFGLTKNKISKVVKQHRLIAIHYIPNPENKPFIDHIDRNPSNNNINNLRWCTVGENKINSKVHGDIPYRHLHKIYEHRNQKYYWKIVIIRFKKRLISKSFNCNKYSLEDVVKIRNDYYIEFGIDIDD